MAFKKNGKQASRDVATGNELYDFIINESKRINRLSTFKLREELEHLGQWVKGNKPIFTRRLKAFYTRTLINHLSSSDDKSEPLIIRDRAGNPYGRCLVNNPAKRSSPSSLNFRGPDAVLDYSRQQHQFEYAVVIDFEATCFAKHAAPPGFQHEIIEFPAVLLHLHTNEPTPPVVDTFHMYCTPVKCPRLDKYCVELTHITQATVTSSLVFAEDDNGRFYVHDAFDDLSDQPAKLHHPLPDIDSPRLVADEDGALEPEEQEAVRRRRVHAAIFPIVLERFERWLAHHNLLPSDAVFSAVDWFRTQQSQPNASSSSDMSTFNSLGAAMNGLDLSPEENGDTAEEELDESAADAVVEREEQQAGESDAENATAEAEAAHEQSDKEEEEDEADDAEASEQQQQSASERVRVLGSRKQFSTEFPRRFVIATHGSADASSFLRVQCATSGIEFPEWGAVWIDLKRLYQAFYCDQKAGTIIELLAHLGMRPTGQLHSGIDDARNLSALLQRMVSDGCSMRPNEEIVLHGVRVPNKPGAPFYSRPSTAPGAGGNASASATSAAPASQTSKAGYHLRFYSHTNFKFKFGGYDSSRNPSQSFSGDAAAAADRTQCVNSFKFKSPTNAPAFSSSGAPRATAATPKSNNYTIRQNDRHSFSSAGGPTNTFRTSPTGAQDSPLFSSPEILSKSYTNAGPQSQYGRFSGLESSTSSSTPAAQVPDYAGPAPMAPRFSPPGATTLTPNRPSNSPRNVSALASHSPYDSLFSSAQYGGGSAHPSAGGPSPAASNLFPSTPSGLRFTSRDWVPSSATGASSYYTSPGNASSSSAPRPSARFSSPYVSSLLQAGQPDRTAYDFDADEQRLPQQPTVQQRTRPFAGPGATSRGRGSSRGNAAARPDGFNTPPPKQFR